jgi:hypothetical protein
MKLDKVLAIAVTIVSPVILVSVAVFPQIAWVLLAVASAIALSFLGNPAFIQVFWILLAAGILGAIGESGQLGNLLAF